MSRVARLSSRPGVACDQVTARARAARAVCDDSADPENYAACVSGAGALGGFLIGSRSVRYQCRASPTGP